MIRRFEGSDVIEICDGITFNFYTGLPHMYAYSCLSWVSQYLNCPPDPTVLSRMGENIELDNPYHTYTLLCGIKWDCPLHSHVYPILCSMWNMCDHPLDSRVFQSCISHYTMWGKWAIQFNTVCVPLHLSIISHCTVWYKWTVHWTPLCISYPTYPTCPSYPTYYVG